jgi:hypothetical protein
MLSLTSGRANHYHAKAEIQKAYHQVPARSFQAKAWQYQVCRNEQLIYEAGRLQDAVSLLNRLCHG